ncbi:MAG: NAD-dependent epimerase/dehydratase family protein [Saprospiraceae bacterium]|nr:NAD-dependent epimerase/dehydratase family protein [Saprospiraceae bacterium]
MDKQHSLVLVTGGTGFLGSYLLRLLVHSGYRVRALKRSSSRMDLVQEVADRVKWVEGDVTDVVALEDAFSGVTHVMHCAAISSFHPRDAWRLTNTNVDGTTNVVNIALEMGVQKLIHVSSIAAFGRAKERPRLDETSKWVQSSGNSRYAVSKYLSEQEVWRAHAEGLPVAIVSPSVILGSGFWDAGSPRFFTQIDQGLKFWPVGRSGFVDVRDVAQFMLHLLESDIDGERYILNAQNTPFRELFNLIAKELGVPPPSIKITPFLAEVAWRVEWLKEKLLGLEPVATKESARSSVSEFYYDNDKSRSVFNFRYRPLEETVRETAQQYREGKKEGGKAKVLGWSKIG